MTLTISLPTLILIGISLALFIVATFLCHSQGLFASGRGGYTGAIEGLIIIIIYLVMWIIPSLLGLAVLATWPKP